MCWTAHFGWRVCMSCSWSRTLLQKEIYSSWTSLILVWTASIPSCIRLSAIIIWAKLVPRCLQTQAHLLSLLLSVRLAHTGVPFDITTGERYRYRVRIILHRLIQWLIPWVFLGRSWCGHGRNNRGHVERRVSLLGVDDIGGADL